MAWRGPRICRAFGMGFVLVFHIEQATLQKTRAAKFLGGVGEKSCAAFSTEFACDLHPDAPIIHRLKRLMQEILEQVTRARQQPDGVTRLRYLPALSPYGRFPHAIIPGNAD